MEGDQNPNYFYRECLRNHAASLGSYATDGCGEFSPAAASSADPLHCTACGCHRNFHRRFSYAGPGRRGRDVDSDAVDSDGLVAGAEYAAGDGAGRKKRYRTKFSGEQKEKMLEFAEKLGWKLQRRDLDDEIERFCRSIGVSRQVFKVWMHNHKNSLASSASNIANASSLTQLD